MRITFKGGIHPLDSKEYNRNAKLEPLPLPEELIISLSQGFGAPSIFSKEVGDKVRRGEKIADPQGPMGNYIYSPVNGEVKELTSITLPTSAIVPAVVIKVDNPNTLLTDDEYVHLPKTDNILEKIKLAGIVGMGGAGFPVHIKYSIKEGKSVDYFIANACECEPYLCADYRLLVEKPSECIKGICIVSKLLKAKTTCIAIEDNKKDTLTDVQKAIDNRSDKSIDIQIKLVKTKYPQGDEKNLVKAIAKREVPSGGLPLDTGCVISNLGTIYAIFEAVEKDKPLMERVVSVTGDAVKTPKNVISPLGATVKNLVDFVQGFETPPQKMISGGPMMGFAFYDENTPVTKTTSGLTFLKKAHIKESTPCISCGRCVASCPMHLVPTKMFKLIQNGKYKEAMDENLMDCRECGCCEFSCPSNIKLVQGFKFGKKMGRMKK